MYTIEAAVGVRKERVNKPYTEKHSRARRQQDSSKYYA